MFYVFFRSKPHLCPRNRMRTVSCPRILCVLWNSSGCAKQSIHQASKNRSCHAIANHEVDLPLCHAPLLLCIESLPNNPRRRNPLHPHHFCGAHHPAPVGNEKSPRTCAGTCQCGTEPHLPIVAEAFTLPHIEHIVSVLGSCPSAWVMRNKRSRLFKAVFYRVQSCSRLFNFAFYHIQRCSRHHTWRPNCSRLVQPCVLSCSRLFNGCLRIVQGSSKQC